MRYPVVGVGAVIVHDGKALIVKRAHAPSKGEWSIPGGRVELGESLAEAVRRELKEETGLDVSVGMVLEVFERIEREGRRVQYHFVIIDYLCTWRGGVLCAGDDAEEVAWVTSDELDTIGVRDSAKRVIRHGLAVAAGHEK